MMQVLVSHEQKSHVEHHFDCHDVMNAMSYLRCHHWLMTHIHATTTKICTSGGLPVLAIFCLYSNIHAVSHLIIIFCRSAISICTCAMLSQKFSCSKWILWKKIGPCHLRSLTNISHITLK